MRSVLLFVLTLFATSLCLGADVYPSRTVRFIAPGVPGNTSDVIGRMISKQLTQQTGKSFVVENRPGASGIIGTEAVARSAGDGYTLLLADSTFTTVPNLRKKLPYDPAKDFTPITQVTAAPLLIRRCSRTSRAADSAPLRSRPPMVSVFRRCPTCPQWVRRESPAYRSTSYSA